MARRAKLEISDALARLKAIEVLGALSAKRLDALARQVAWSQYENDELVLSHLDEGADFYVLSEGALDVRLESPLGRGVAVRRLRAGAHFGELAALIGVRRSASLCAKGSVLVGQIAGAQFQDLLENEPGFARAIAKELARSVVHLTERVYELAALEVRFRLYGQLLRLARGASEGPSGLVIAEAPTHEVLSEMIGAQREAVTREMNYLVRQGILLQDRPRLIITDLHRLTEMFTQRAGPSQDNGL